MKKLILTATSLIALGATSTSASASDDLSVQTGIDFVSQYVFRGASLGDNSVQPFVEATTYGVTIGAWASTGMGPNSIAAGDEIDLYLGYSLPISDDYAIDLGATYYYYPQSGKLFGTSGGSTGSYEVSGGISFDEIALSPTATVFYDFTLNALTLQGELGHSVELDESHSLELGLTGGLVDVASGSSSDYKWATASAAIAHAFNEDTSAYIGANYTLNSDKLLDFDKTLASKPKSDLFWIGTGISSGF